MPSALPSPASLDDSTAQAVQVLALAVQRERVPGIIEFSQASEALTRAAVSRNLQDLEYASVAFDSLEPGFRARVVERAYDLARTERGRLRIPQLPNTGVGLSENMSGKAAGRARNRLLADLGRPPLSGQTAAKAPAPEPEACDLAPTLEEIVPFQARTPSGPPPKWWE